jgi:hypothetical protein
MQTDEWMAYSCSSCFSDQYSYRTLFISNYGLKDMNFARFKHFSAKTKEKGTAWGELGRTCTVLRPIWAAAGDE